MRTNSLFYKIKCRLLRNRLDDKGNYSLKNKVNVEYSRTINVGDTLSPLVVSWVTDRQGIPFDKDISKTKHLFAIGSVLGRGRFDATVWGTGILSEKKQDSLIRQKKYRKYDIRAVRGPETRKMLMGVGYDCPEVFGDPGILMPMIYQPETRGKKYPVSVILHHRTIISDETKEIDHKIHLPSDIHVIDPCTADYKTFINEIVASEYVISSSLHGIILAEAYGVPAIFLIWGIEDQLFKFHDWYHATGRETIYAKTLEEALKMPVPVVPELQEMQEIILKAFPLDLWE